MAQIVEKLSTDVAETVEVIELDIQMLCRVCGTIHETLIPIFDNEGLENEILDKINKYLPIRITQDGNLPSKICIKCANLLIMWNDLVLNCIETDKKLTNVLEFSDQYYEMKLKKTKDREKEEFEKVLNDVLEKNDMKKQLSANLEIGGEEQANIPYRREVTDNEAIIQENEENELDIIKRFEHPMTSTNQCSTSSAGATTFDNSDIANIKYEVIRAKKDNGTYSCTKCDYKCTKRTKFYNHMFESHNVQNKKIIESSKVVIDDKVYYQCSQCQKQLGSANTFSWHLLIHSGERPFVCDQCGKKFRISSGLSRHIKEVHENSREFACDLCDRKFGNRRNVIEHRRLHTNERPYVCDDCGKTFKQKASLFVHKRGHSLVFPFQCSECDLSFRTQPAMMLHVSVHSGHRPHACDMCDRKFRIKHELKKHKLTHSDVKPFSCDVCGLKFRQKRYVKRHYKSKHPELPLPDSVQSNKKTDKASRVAKKNKDVGDDDSENYCDENVVLDEDDGDTSEDGINPINTKENQCPYCKEDVIHFPKKDLLIVHFKDKHSDLIFHCEMCDEFLDRSILISHMIQHAEITPVQNKLDSSSSSSTTRNSVTKDINSNLKNNSIKDLPNNHPNGNKNKLKCYVCNKIFANRTSIKYHQNQVHLKIKNFGCYHCGKSFGTKKLLLNHIKCVHSLSRNYKCKKCQKLFKTDVALYSHSRIHEVNALQFSCNYCDKKFRFRHHLSNHELLHRNQKEYNCQLCPKEFNTKLGLSKHLLTHNTELKYNCSVYQFAAKQKRYVLAHMKRKHEC